MSFGGRARRGSAVLLLIPLLLSACGLSDDEAGGAIDTVKIAAKTEVPAGTLSWSSPSRTGRNHCRGTWPMPARDTL